MNQKGFTLIEVMIYIALLSMLMSSVLLITYRLLDNRNKLSTKIIIQEEANFLLQKIDYAFNGATAVSTTSSPPTLTITQPGPTTLTFSLNVASSSLQLKTNAGSKLTLNSSNVKIASVAFQPSTIGSLKAVRATFTVNGQQFQTTKYLRQ